MSQCTQMLKELAKSLRMPLNENPCKKYDCDYFAKFGFCECFAYCYKCQREEFILNRRCTLCNTPVGSNGELNTFDKCENCDKVLDDYELSHYGHFCRKCV